MPPVPVASSCYARGNYSRSIKTGMRPVFATLVAGQVPSMCLDIVLETAIDVQFSPQTEAMRSTTSGKPWRHSTISHSPWPSPRPRSAS